MKELSTQEKLKLLPQPVKKTEQVPSPCSIGQYYPNIVLRNDGFNAEAVYSLESFYAHFANILGNMERMQVDGAVLRDQTTETGRRINISLLYDARIVLTSGFSVEHEGTIKVSRTTGVPPSILHREPETWSYQGQLEDGTEVVFHPVYDIPVNFTADASGEGNQDPSIVIAYGSNGVADYAFRNFMNPPASPNQRIVSDKSAEEAVVLIAKEVSSKLAQIKGFK